LNHLVGSCTDANDVTLTIDSARVRDPIKANAL
jgi:hypothetical protein